MKVQVFLGIFSAMKTYRAFAAFFALAFLPALLPALDAEAAWQAAAAMTAQAEAWKASEMGMTIVEFAKDGVEKSREESSYRLSYGADGKVESELIRAMKDGKDITEERRAESSSKKGRGWGRPGQGEGGGMPQLFKPPAGDTVERGQAYAGVHSARAVWVFPFRYRVKGGLSYEGELFLDKADGRPVALSGSAGKGIPGLEYMKMDVRYADNGQAGLVDRLEMRMKGRFLLKRIDYAFGMGFTGYAPPGTAAGHPR